MCLFACLGQAGGWLGRAVMGDGQSWQGTSMRILSESITTIITNTTHVALHRGFHEGQTRQRCHQWLRQPGLAPLATSPTSHGHDSRRSDLRGPELPRGLPEESGDLVCNCGGQGCTVSIRAMAGHEHACVSYHLLFAPYLPEAR